KSVTFLVGFTRPTRPPCTGDESDEDCIQNHLSANPATINSYWGNRSILLARLALTFTYLLFTGSFAFLVGLIVLKEKALEAVTPARRPSQKPRKKRPAKIETE